jgi:hypothetical protein
MALKNPHLGWIGEHFAKFLISKFAFIAQPATIGDDIGADLFCTVFKQINDDKELQPQSSFAIQIKTNKEPFQINNKLNFLEKLELPYFVGVVDITNGELEIYSGESIPHFFSLYGNIIESTNEKYKNAKVYIKLIDDHFGELISEPMKDSKKSNFHLNFPKIACINSNFDLKVNERLLDKFYTTISKLQKNISRRISNVYLFEMIFGQNSGKNFVIAGPGSAQTYSNNLMDRLTESFYNIQRIIQVSPADFNVKEFESYEKFYRELILIFEQYPPLLKSKYEECKKAFDSYEKEKSNQSIVISSEPTFSNGDISHGSNG